MSASTAATAAGAATTAANAVITAARGASSRPAATSPLGLAIVVLAMLALLWLVFSLFAAGQPLTGIGVMAFGAAAIAVYGTATSLAWRYLFPGVAGMLLFVAFPLVYTVQIGFTNYSSANLLEYERARAYLLSQTTVDEAHAYDVTVHAAEGGGHRLALTLRESGARFETQALDLRNPVRAEPVEALRQAQGERSGAPLDLREVIALRDRLQQLKLQAPDGKLLSYAGLREFAPLEPVWTDGAKHFGDGSLVQTATKSIYKPNYKTGFFENEAGERVSPGFKVGIGFANYSRMLFDADFRGPFVSIFIWTVVFAALSVVFAGGLGLTLAVLLNWEALSHRTLYRTLLFLPYAVPGFISILVFKGLFNQNFGEINAILNSLFGIRPAWFADPWLAKTMLLIVNTWLGFPYFMILCTGLIKAIPADLYEASAIAGAKPLDNFFKITAPLILKPLTPLLIAAFAFNFNNFVLIALLTDGRPDFLNTKLPAGTTDILVSYTYRIAFTDAGQNFGLAAAISTIIFAMVAIMALLQLKATQKGKV
jgi:maltose/maltodextrin transport system permease protein